MTKIEAVIFDWDGVVSDSAGLQVEAEQVAAQALAEERGIELDVASIDWTAFEGWGRVKIAASLFNVEPTAALAETYRNQVVDASVSIINEGKLSPVEGVLSFFDYMRMRVGPLAVATSSNRKILDPSIALFGLGNHILTTVAHRECVDDKPKPGPYIEAMRRLHVAPERTLVVEDSASGITAGRCAGAMVLGIATTKSAEYLRTSTDAQLVAEDFKQAANLLQSYLK